MALCARFLAIDPKMIDVFVSTTACPHAPFAPALSWRKRRRAPTPHPPAVDDTRPHRLVPRHQAPLCLSPATNAPDRHASTARPTRPTPRFAQLSHPHPVSPNAPFQCHLQSRPSPHMAHPTPPMSQCPRPPPRLAQCPCPTHQPNAPLPPRPPTRPPSPPTPNLEMLPHTHPPTPRDPPHPPTNARPPLPARTFPLENPILPPSTPRSPQHAHSPPTARLSVPTPNHTPTNCLTTPNPPPLIPTPDYAQYSHHPTIMPAHPQPQWINHAPTAPSPMPTSHRT
ncbi:uncharacterized protein [Salvelinus sp. IW2-2015]|uniref:uncharacterized protein n=1 Tax=Salvelinus sp. IW2-2015 TaxID=2691554 RepID=UPI0038D3A2D0